MNNSRFNSFRHFIKMHIDLIKSFYLIDMLLLICTVWYLFTPVTVGIYPFRTIVLLFLLFLGFIGLHVRVLASQIGSIGFYRLLPVHRFGTYFKSHMLAILPFMVVLFSIAVFPVSNTATEQKLLKAFHILAVFCTIKLLALPALLLLRRSLFLLPLLFLLIIPIAIFISAGNECIWGSLPFPDVWDMMIYSLLLFGLETIIIKTIRVR
ncbi:MAG: hypothetical protein JW915_24820 [Chitinispirillaceae bacterium]|nr:hypothetical protein [Chitinispirillaceae bacterium]